MIRSAWFNHGPSRWKSQIDLKVLQVRPSNRWNNGELLKQEIRLTFFQDFLIHFILNISKSSITQGRGTRFWQLAKKDIPSFAKTSASFKNYEKTKRTKGVSNQILHQSKMCPKNKANVTVFDIISIYTSNDWTTKCELENKDIKRHQFRVLMNWGAIWVAVARKHTALACSKRIKGMFHVTNMSSSNHLKYMACIINPDENSHRQTSWGNFLSLTM